MLTMKLDELNTGLILLAAVCGCLSLLLVAMLILGRHWRHTLQQRLGVYTSMMDSSPDALALIGPDYRYQIINQAFAQRAGRPREAVIGRLVPEVIGKQVFNDLIKPKLDQALDGNLVRYNAWFDWPAEGRRFVLVTYAPYRQPPGRADVDGILLCAHDITDHERIEQAQFTTKYALQAMLDNSPMMACVKDPELRILSLNKRGEELLGVCADEVIGQRTEDVFPAPAAAKIAEHDRRILQTKAPQTTEDRLPTPNGERLMMSTRFPWLDSNHDISALCTLSLDVTELEAGREAQRQATALRESERRFRVMADSLPTMTWLVDAEGQIEYVNRAFTEYFGVTTAQMATTGCCALVHPGDFSRVQARMASALKDRQAFHLELRARRADQRWRWLSCSARPLFEDDGRFVGFVGSGRDIERRKQADKALHRSRKQLKEHAYQLSLLAQELTRAEQRERMRLAQVLHDHLQQLLVGATMATARLDWHLQDSCAQELAKLKMLLNEAIGISRNLTSDLWPQVLHNSSFSDALNWLAQSMRKRYELEVSLALEPSLSPEDDMLRGLLFDCVREALFNVIKHAGVMEARIELRKRGERALRIMISDRGKGLAASEGEHSPSSGCHLGLTSMRERMRLLGGSATVTDNPDGGTLVILDAPLETPQQPQQVRSAPAVFELVESAPITPACRLLQAPRPIKPVTVLLVDDHVVLRDALSSLLSEERHWLLVIGEASNGREAIEKVRQLQPDMVLMDFAMPEMNGLEATRIIHHRWPSIRVIGLSLHQETDRAGAMIEAGAVDYISKTSVTYELIDKLRLHAGIDSNPPLVQPSGGIDSSPFDQHKMPSSMKH
ncbi:PAS domain-containing protein [Halochromatium roseum]|uniref:PAS domain-containing protein n=1 Tax=Halochromatium roseum TaxID=391920 RepID=UPI001911FC4A|nr:PAS domain-containing protein [Halochromatium roseum]MBK5940199.1 hypothetical protein [Halochromatium roseum]